MTKQLKKPISVISTDWHLKSSNIEEIKDLVRQQCELALKLGVKEMFCLGDVFHSRAGQTVEVLKAFLDILDIIGDYKLILVAIPGNHDRTNYDSEDSFLDSFRDHHSFHLVKGFGEQIENENINFTFAPYFRENMWIELYNHFKSIIKKTSGELIKKNILLSHIALNGSVNNDGSKVNCNISTTDFKEFDLVLLGHYHNQQQLAPNIFHIPSIYQSNFGENPEKGFTVLYDDCSIELVKSKFKEYKKITIDLDTITKKELTVITKENTNSKDYIRFEFIGDSNVIKSLNKDEFTSLGIDVKIKLKELEDTIEYAEQEIKEHDTTSIKNEFLEFCNNTDKDFEEGLTYLNKKLEK